MKRLDNWQLEHTTPEEVGVDSNAIADFLEEIQEKGLKLQSFTIVKDNKVCSQGFFKPYRKEHPHILYSVSKSVTSTAIGFAISEGLLNLNDRICDIFPEYVMSKRPFNRMITVRMLLTMHTDKAITFLVEKGGNDWIEEFLGATFMLPPNSKFNYLSENTFMLSAIIKRVTGQSVVDYLYPRIFEPLGIEKPFWESDGDGNNAGGWGLYMRSEDIAKFFLPYINDGKWIDGTQLIPSVWVREATRKQVNSVRDGYIDYMEGYGYQFWRNPVANSWRADGLFGQRCLMFPDYNALVVLNSGEPEDYKIMDVFWKYFPNCFGSVKLESNKKAQERLNSIVDNLAVEDLPSAPRNYELESQISGRLIKTKTSELVSLITVTVSHMLYNKIGCINEIKFDFKEDKLLYYWKEKEYENTIEVGLNGEYLKSKIKLGDLVYHTYSKATWQEDGSLKLWIRPIETAHERRYTFKFKEKEVKIISDMDPVLEELVIYYMTFMGLPIKSAGAEEIVKYAVKNLGVPIIEPDFKGRFVDEEN